MVLLPEMILIPTSMEHLSLLCISLLSIFILYFTLKRRNVSRSTKISIPSPPKLPFIGNIHQLSSLYHQSLHLLSLKYGPLMLLHLGQVPWLVVSSADLACAIMRTHDLTFATRPSAVVADIIRFGDLVFEPYGEDWRQLKKIFTIHLMGTKKVNSYKTIREEEVANLIAKISGHATIASDSPLELSKLLFQFMTDLVCRVVSGKFIMEEQRYKIMQEIVDENSYLVGRFSIGDLFPSLTCLEKFIGFSKRASKNKEKWDMFLEELIQAHVESEENEKENDNFVDILLSLKNDPNSHFDLTIEQMKGLLLDAFGAGIDTSYITLDWAISELVKNPESMKKLQEEVRGVVQQNDMVRTDDLNQMNFLKCVIKETLRLHPPAPLLLPRESMEQCELNGFIIPKGTKVIINAWAIGREAKFWEAPEEFKPERFINNKVDFKGNDFQFIPFGAGRRICPGMSFATATTELALANLIHHFDWELPSGMTREEFKLDDSSGVTVKRKDDLCLVVKKV